MDPGAVRQRRNDDRPVAMGRSRKEIADMVVDDEGHLPVRQHGSLGSAGGTGRIEIPAWIIAIDGNRRNRPSKIARNDRVIVFADP